MKTVAAGQFKAHCLALLDEVAKTHRALVITKYGEPVACVTPCPAKAKGGKNPLKGTILFEKDIVSPVDVKWEAAQ